MTPPHARVEQAKACRIERGGRRQTPTSPDTAGPTSPWQNAGRSRLPPEPEVNERAPAAIQSGPGAQGPAPTRPAPQADSPAQRSRGRRGATATGKVGDVRLRPRWANTSGRPARHAGKSGGALGSLALRALLGRAQAREGQTRGSNLARTPPPLDGTISSSLAFDWLTVQIRGRRTPAGPRDGERDHGGWRGFSQVSSSRTSANHSGSPNITVQVGPPPSSGTLKSPTDARLERKPPRPSTGGFARSSVAVSANQIARTRRWCDQGRCRLGEGHFDIHPGRVDPAPAEAIGWHPEYRSPGGRWRPSRPELEQDLINSASARRSRSFSECRGGESRRYCLIDSAWNWPSAKVVVIRSRRPDPPTTEGRRGTGVSSIRAPTSPPTRARTRLHAPSALASERPNPAPEGQSSVAA